MESKEVKEKGKKINKKTQNKQINKSKKINK
jgi:hypothetical protein